MADTPAKSRRPRGNGHKSNNFNVVGIGASAGGIGALEQLFERLPSDSGMAFVVVVHLSPEHESALSELIQRNTRMPVIKVMGSEEVKPDHVYVIPPAKYLVIRDGHVSLQEPDMEKGRRISVDVFLRTLAAAYHVKSVGVLLSGTGTDGTLGLRHIKEAGGVTIAQDPHEAEYDGMPRNAINYGVVDFVLPVSEIPKKLISLRQISDTIQTPPETGKPLAEADDEALREVLSILRTRTGNDFSNYKKPAVLRRVTRRLQVNAVADIGSYVTLLREQPSEARNLLADMIISVTNFFRDPEAFKVLETKVIPKLFESKGPDDQVRAWVTGCATGEEAYSLAILLLNHAQNLKDPPVIQVFATDIDQEAIDGAREGVFVESISSDVPPDLLQRFFSKDQHFYRIKKEVRELVLFAPHNILRDPPFSKLDLVSCRNLLIYFNRETQERALELFHFALRPNGYIFLGASESADSLPELFVAVDKKHRVFKRRAVTSSTPYLPSLPVKGRWERKPLDLSRNVRKAISYGEVHHQIIEQYAPPSVLISSDYEIVHLSESAGQFLRFAGGEPSRNLIKVVHPELRLDLRAALLTATQREKPTETRRLRIEVNGEVMTVKVRVRPAAAEGFMVVFFEEVESIVDRGQDLGRQVSARPVGDIEPLVRQMEEELQQTKDQLRVTLEQHETSIEELKASNEELQAINEELRSATEELETSKEELQSLNEELRTVNHEMKEKVDELHSANGDLQNLLAASDIGTIFLDRKMHVKRYTPAIQRIFNVIPSDVNRPIGHITHSLEYDGLHNDAEHVLSTLMRLEREVRSAEGRWYIVRLLPYRTVEDKIEGVVITFLDSTERKLVQEEREQLHKELERKRSLVEAVVRQMPAGVIVTEAGSGGVLVSNEQADLIWREAMDRSGTDDTYTDYPGYHEDGRPYTREEWPMWRSLNTGETVRDEEIRMRCGDGSWGSFCVSSSPVRDNNGEIIAAVVTFTDVTEEKRANASLRTAQARIRALVESIQDYAIFTLDEHGIIDSWNPGAEKIFGYTESEAIGQTGAIIFTQEDRDAGVPEEERQKALTEGRAEDERWHIRKDGSLFYASGMMNALLDPENIGSVKILRDLTPRKQMEEELRRSRDEMEARVKERTRQIKLSYEALENEISERRAADDQVKELLRRVVNTQELERRRIARDLHDQFGQQLTALRLSLESLREQIKDEEVSRRIVEQIQAAAEQIDKEVDFLAWELRPSSLDELGLEATVENFVHEWSGHFGIPAQFHAAGFAGARLSPESETNLYRIAQEALNNVYKHSGAERVGVILERRDNNAVLIIEDDGRGFNADEESKSTRAFGLVSMRERASLSGGSLEIQSAPGEGTTIFVRVPIVNPKDRT